LHNKQQVPHHIQNFIAYVQNQFDTTVKCVGSDNGTEIFQALCSSILHQNGILLQRSVPRTPQQNGRVERKHRHLVETARAIKIHANLPPKFWGSCILAATYIINRMPTSLLQWKSPFETLFHTKPNLSHLKIIGCLCYALDLSPHIDKFSPKDRRCIFLGYPSTQKAFKLYDLDTHKVFVSRDVHFEENIFPFHKESSRLLQHHTPTSYLPIAEINTPSSPLHTHLPDNTLPLSSSPPTTQAEHEIPRRTSRIHKPPTWLQDYAYSINTDTLYPLFHARDFQNYQPEYITSLYSVLSIKEPYTYAQAIKDPRWIEAMNNEIAALEANHT